MMMRHLPPGSLDPQARKDHLAHAHALHTDRCRGGWRPRRRTFTARDKLRILAATDRAAETGGIGAILRREGIYSSTLCDWRRQRDAAASGALTPAKRGPKPAEPNPLLAEVALLQRSNARLTRCLARAEAIIEVQKNLADLLGIPLDTPLGTPPTPNGDGP